ncbi:MAG: hypothetical protein IIY37_02200 [Selenomonadaceae bacterium]|nr:hypothetical protein [Selenomonadaceae bacterium]MBQ1510011.1 hypothetical protein [Selenomonadaceae bacterium]
MGAIDTEAKAYMSDRNRFADAFNFSIYDGEYVIAPDSLSPMDTTAIALPYGLNAKTAIQKYRDLLKLYAAMQDGQAIYLVLGLELQTRIHYSMPVRGMLYDALNYSQQVTEAAASYRKNSASQSNEEFLSGFHKGDRLMPVITLTLCLSAEPWDAPTSLHEMLSVTDERLLKFVPNYKLNLLTPAQIAEEDFDKFRTGLGAVMQFTKHRNDHDVNWMAGNKRFEEMDRETADLIKTVTGADIRFDEKGDVVNMWAAWENGINQARNDGRTEGRTEGRIEGRIEGREEATVSTIRNLMETSGWDAKQTMNAMKIPASEQEKYAKQI